MLILDSLSKAPYKTLLNQKSKEQEKNSTTNFKQSPNSPNVLKDKKEVDRFLQAVLTPKPLIPRIHTLKPKNPMNVYASLFDKNLKIKSTHQGFKDFSPNEKEILKKIINYSHSYRQILRDAVKRLNIESCNLNSISLDKQDIKFIKKIDSKLKANATIPITLQEANESQKFLELEMDKIILEIYQENPKIIQKMINKNYQSLTKNPLEINDESLGEDEKISTLFLEYGIKIESSLLKNRLENLLETIPLILKDSINRREIDTQSLKTLEDNINLYRESKMEATGYRLFAALTDRLSTDQQEKITDSIAQVLSFYSQPNSLEAKGYKISWQPQYLNTSVVARRTQ